MIEKTIDDYVEQIYPVECLGRNKDMRAALDMPVIAQIRIHKTPGSSMISSLVKCKYNTGGHGQRCKASHPNTDKVGEGIICPYSFDIFNRLDYERETEDVLENLPSWFPY